MESAFKNFHCSYLVRRQLLKLSQTLLHISLSLNTHKAHETTHDNKNDIMFSYIKFDERWQIVQLINESGKNHLWFRNTAL